MGDRVPIDKNGMLLLLYNKNRQDWIDATGSVTAVYTAYYYGNFTGYNICFRGKDKSYFYKKSQVMFLNKLHDINFDHHDIYADGQLVNAFRLEQFENGYYRVIHQRGSLVTRSIELRSIRYKELFAYFCQLAEYAGSIAGQDNPLLFLSRNFTRIGLPSRGTALFDYLHGTCQTFSAPKNIILPFDFNQSQLDAARAALSHNISIIEGPPGTGKTQAILTLIANLVSTGKSCAVISNNNSAIANVYEKLADEGFAFIAALLGRQSNVEEFFAEDRMQQLVDFLKRKKMPVEPNAQTTLRKLIQRISLIQQTEVALARLAVEIAELEHQQRHHAASVQDGISMNAKLPSEAYLAFMQNFQTPEKIGWFRRLLLRFKYKVKISEKNLHTLLDTAGQLYYQAKLAELQNKSAYYESYMLKWNKDETVQRIKTLSRYLFENQLNKKYESAPKVLFSKETYRENYESFLHRYPVVLSTTQSLLNNVPGRFVFDWLIIDEASQSDLLSSVLAISCAKNLVVVGDSRQLQQIDAQQLHGFSQDLIARFAVPEPYHYQNNSLLQSVHAAVSDAPVTLLREQYRCAPDIINFCNRMFYDNELIPMRKNSGQHIEIIKTVPGNHARRNPNGSGLYNQREIDELGELLKSSDAHSVGVITPFRCQADRIAKTYSVERLEVDTVHKFQGRQKQEVILSFVVNSLERQPDNGTNRLYDFVTDEKLFNVAITRAQDKVTAILSDKVYHSTDNVISDFIKYAEYLYGSTTVLRSTVRSVFDLLYSEYTELLLSKYKARPGEHVTELLMCDLIQQLLQDRPRIGYAMHTRLAKLVNVPDTFSDSEKNYLLHPWTHVDFLFYKKVSKEILFVLEVDGIRYHEQQSRQAEHDAIKERVLAANNIPLYRFKTNESNELQRLEEILDGFQGSHTAHNAK